MPVMAAGVHLPRILALIVRVILLGDGQGVNVRPEHDAAGLFLALLSPLNLADNARPRDAPMGKAQLVQLPLDGGLGLEFLPRKLRVTVEMAAEFHHIIMILLNLLIEGLFQFGHRLFPFCVCLPFTDEASGSR